MVHSIALEKTKRTSYRFVCAAKLGLRLVESLDPVQRVEDGLEVDRVGKQVLEVFPPTQGL